MMATHHRNRKKIIGYACAAILVLFLPTILKSPYYMHMVIMTFLNAIFALGFVMILSVGIISLGQAGFWAIGSYTSAILAMKLGFPFWLALPAAGFTTGIIAFLFGAIALRRGVGTIILLTFAFAEVTELTISHTPSLTGGLSMFTGISRPEAIPIPFNPPIEFISKAPYYYLILFLLIITILTYQALYHSRVGRAFKAISRSEHLAESLGIHTFRYKLMAFTVAGFFTGLGGSFYAHYQNMLDPTVFNTHLSLYIQIYAIIGGLGSYILGPLIGSAVMTIVPELLRIGREFSSVIFGAILLLIMAFLPGGLVSLPEAGSAWLKKRKGGIARDHDIA